MKGRETMVVKIQKASIKKMKVVYNKQKKTMDQLQKELGCQCIINLTLFNMSDFTPTSYLSVDGILLGMAGNPYGFAVNADKIVFSYANNVNYPDFAGCYTKGTLASVAQFSEYDYVLEIHLNAFQAGASDGKTKGVECYVTTSETGITVEKAICEKVANVGLTNRGVKRTNFNVIQAAKKAGVSSALLEVCFIDDPDDMAVYTAYRDEIAAAIADGIREGFGLEEATTTTPTTPPAADNETAEPWYTDVMKWAKENGIMDGTRPTEAATRAEVATMIRNFAEKIGKA